MAYNNHMPLKVIASKREYDIVTTKPDDILKAEQKQEKPKEVQEIEPKKRFSITKKVQLKNELTTGQIDILLREGFHEVRDPGFSQGRGSSYLIKNDTGETDAHFILWNLIYEEVRKYTDKVVFNLTREPDIVFTVSNRSIAIEVESTKRSEKALAPKLAVLQKYDKCFFVVTNKWNKDTYKEYGETLTRIEVQEKIASYFQGESSPESKTKLDSGSKIK